ncbi:MAG: 16S rRNA processing protein RimM, partial [Lachnospiraceae bacterium]
MILSNKKKVNKMIDRFRVGVITSSH